MAGVNDYGNVKRQKPARSTGESCRLKVSFRADHSPGASHQERIDSGCAGRSVALGVDVGTIHRGDVGAVGHGVGAVFAVRVPVAVDGDADVMALSAVRGDGDVGAIDIRILTNFDRRMRVVDGDASVLIGRVQQLRRVQVYGGIDAEVVALDDGDVLVLRRICTDVVLRGGGNRESREDHEGGEDVFHDG